MPKPTKEQLKANREATDRRMAEWHKSPRYEELCAAREAREMERVADSRGPEGFSEDTHCFQWGW